MGLFKKLEKSNCCGSALIPIDSNEDNKKSNCCEPDCCDESDSNCCS